MRSSGGTAIWPPATAAIRESGGRASSDSRNATSLVGAVVTQLVTRHSSSNDRKEAAEPSALPVAMPMASPSAPITTAPGVTPGTGTSKVTTPPGVALPLDAVGGPTGVAGDL